MARLLVVTSRLPCPPREGHQLRSWHLLQALASRHEVHLLSCLRGDDEPTLAGPLREVVASMDTFPIAATRSNVALAGSFARSIVARQPFVVAKYASSALRGRIAALARDADLVHFDMLPLMAYADAVPAGTPVLYNAHNVEHALLEARVGVETRPWLRMLLRGQQSALRAFEQAACARADLVLACSASDADALRALSPGSRVAVVPNGIDLEANQPSVSGERAGAGMVFVGQMGWFPNRDGVQWFLEDVLPRILAVRPDAGFVLVGNPSGLRVPADVAGSVTLAGYVPDLRPVVHDAAVYVVPLRIGSGTRLKVLEAMALGMPIVTTRIGSEGIRLRHGESALYADTADEFAAATLALLADPELGRRLGRAARACAEAHYGWDAIGRDLLDACDGLLSHGPS